MVFYWLYLGCFSFPCHLAWTGNLPSYTVHFKSHLCPDLLHYTSGFDEYRHVCYGSESCHIDGDRGSDNSTLLDCALTLKRTTRTSKPAQNYAGSHERAENIPPAFLYSLSSFIFCTFICGKY